MVVTPTGAPNADIGLGLLRVCEIGNFRPISRCIMEMVQDRGVVNLIYRTNTQSYVIIKRYHFRLPWTTHKFPETRQTSLFCSLRFGSLSQGWPCHFVSYPKNDTKLLQMGRGQRLLIFFNLRNPILIASLCEVNSFNAIILPQRMQQVQCTDVITSAADVICRCVRV